jgi:peptidoglycan/LPS O-acetylase OafA/YrhL
MTTADAVETGVPIDASNRLQCIDVLRGIAILAVILMHVPHDAPGGFRLNPWFFPAWLLNFGYLGVHLFVLISGFCIHRRAAIEKKISGHWNVSWGRFWLRRFWRLYPPYVVAIGLSILAARYLHDSALRRQVREQPMSLPTYSWLTICFVSLRHRWATGRFGR